VLEDANVSEDALLLPPGHGQRIENPLGGEIVFKARAAQTAGSMTVFEALNPPGQGPPYHVHDALDEVIYVLDGTLRVRLEEKIEEAPAGSFVFIPRGVRHTWQGLGESVRFLVVLAPAGLEEFFENTAAAGGTQAGDAFSRFGGDDLRVVGPPLAVSHPL
jgi:quercetin dioxygenase-like cupin family protein